MATKSATAITSSLCASCGQELECSIRPKCRTTTSWVRAGFECSWCGKKIEGAVYRYNDLSFCCARHRLEEGMIAVHPVVPKQSTREVDFGAAALHHSFGVNINKCAVCTPFGYARESNVPGVLSTPPTRHTSGNRQYWTWADPTVPGET